MKHFLQILLLLTCSKITLAQTSPIKIIFPTNDETIFIKVDSMKNGTAKIDSICKSYKAISLNESLKIASEKDEFFKEIEIVELNLNEKKWIVTSTSNYKKLSVFSRIISFKFSGVNMKVSSKTLYINSSSGKIEKMEKEKSYGIADYPRY